MCEKNIMTGKKKVKILKINKYVWCNERNISIRKGVYCN